MFGSNPSMSCVVITFRHADVNEEIFRLQRLVETLQDRNATLELQVGCDLVNNADPC
ncbi:hypothetical protein DPMN_113593 [Dreissena polymorpha]|uniref:Uncharacterized protein n=1 Tax=Dreissena polymorpha TaxID=45954 RepID=A0A9D4QQZ0_DREPO|nr:hypothetical protein DPMN_113593 [Dreissena polymorpha]